MNDANKILLDENESLKHQNYILSERIKELEESNYKLNRDIFELKNNVIFRDGFYFRSFATFTKFWTRFLKWRSTGKMKTRRMKMIKTFALKNNFCV